jgi:hypothetical protein
LKFSKIQFDYISSSAYFRLIFAACGQAYIDNRVNQSDWPSLKPTTPFGQLPTLEIIEGNHIVYYAESHAIGNKNKFSFKSVKKDILNSN